MVFENLQQLRDFVETISKEKFCTKMLQDDDGRRCVAGHLNMRLHGNVYWKWVAPSYEDSDLEELLTDLGASIDELIAANNSDEENPKRGALKYLDSILSKN